MKKNIFWTELIEHPLWARYEGLFRTILEQRALGLLVDPRLEAKVEQALAKARESGFEVELTLY